MQFWQIADRLRAWLMEAFWPRGMACLCCGEASSGALLCEDCQRELDTLRLPDDAAAVWQYEGCARQLVIGLKHRCMADCAEVLAEGMAGRIRLMDLPPDTVLTWVTMPDKRRRERGIDHGRTLCEAAAVRLHLPARQMLTRTRSIHTQQGLNRAERLANLSGTFRCEGPIATPVLLIDDVTTTGATLQACSEALRRAGCPAVYVMTATMAGAFIDQIGGHYADKA